MGTESLCEDVVQGVRWYHGVVLLWTAVPEMGLYDPYVKYGFTWDYARINRWIGHFGLENVIEN